MFRYLEFTKEGRLKPKRFFKESLVLSFFLAVVLAGIGVPKIQPAAAGPLDRLKMMVADVIRVSPGHIGVAVKDLESNQEFDLNGSSYFPMASTIKLPVCVEVMAQVDEGKLRLSDEIALQSSDQFYEGGLLSDLETPGITLSLKNLINMMMIYSDNTAADVLIRRVGLENVGRRLQSWGVNGFIISRPIKELLYDYWGIDYETHKLLNRDEFEKVYKKMARQNASELEEAARRFSLVMKDQCTPLAMNGLLEKIFKKTILSPLSCERIVQIMLNCQTGLNRIRSLLPPETLVAHKTGTIGGTVNDCGLLYIPTNSKHIALSILSKNTDPRGTEAMIAAIAKSVYDYFYFIEPKSHSYDSPSVR
jgi:beta-lactamase class A